MFSTKQTRGFVQNSRGIQRAWINLTETKIKMLLLCLVIVLCHMSMVVAINDEVFFVSKLETAAKATKASLDLIYKNWQIDKFPYFLKSCYMHKASWEMLKLRFQKKILAALTSTSVEKQKFVISFTGRYVDHIYIFALVPIIFAKY